MIQTSLYTTQTKLKNNSNLYERILLVAKNHGIAGPTELAKYLGYNNPEKIYRLNRINEKTGEFNNPSFEIILDLTNKFEDMDVRWLISGVGEPDLDLDRMAVMEPTPLYRMDEFEALKKRVSELEKKVLQVQEMLQKS